jgi:hypothetical protein
VEADAALVSGKASAILGRTVSVEVRLLSSQPKKAATPDERVELVKRIFRGEIVEGGS